MANKNRIIVFTNVVFGQYGNQSVLNFVEGLLLHDHEVVFLTVHPHENEHMRKFVDQYPDLTVVYLLKSLPKPVNTQIPTRQHRIIRRLKELAKQTFTYRQYSSNSGVFQWLSLWNTFTILRLLVRYLRNHQELVAGCDKYIFVDVFGGLAAHYIRFSYPSFWAEISSKSVGYYLGTVLKQFNGQKLRAFSVMPLSFIGSYKVPYDRMIITDDGTDGANIFQSMLGFRNSILFIRNGIDTRLASFEPPSRSRQYDAFRFVTCSRLTSWKRIDRAIRFVHYVKAFTSWKVNLTIIGEGEELDALEALAYSLDLNDTVTFVGPLDYQTALQRIAENDYYIVFNDLSNMGNQINESIVLGLIPLTIDDGSTDSLLRNGVDSLKFPMTNNFEAGAARIFIDKMSDENRHALHQNLMVTKRRVFTWRERNQLEHEFIFSSRPAEVNVESFYESY